MTSYEVSYAHLDSFMARAKALQDVKDYLGEAMFDKINAAFLDTYRKTGKALPLEKFEIVVSLAGVRGFPVQVWHEYLFKTEES